VSTRAGIVLAGGYARRFGDGDKTLAELDGKPLLAHAVAALRPVVDSVVVSCREEQRPAFEAVVDGVRLCPDPTPDQGPLAGLAAALSAVDADATALAAADMPRVPTGLYESLFLELGPAEAVVVRDEGYLQPAPGAYRTDPLRAAVESARERGEKRLRTVFEALTVEPIDGDGVRARWGEDVLVDVNTTETLAALEE
jgi:molybdopterin-guanine dinucleotide biosynthesis protein A